MKHFSGKVAVVTGAASGIGTGLVERCAKEGMRLVLADVNAGGLDALGEKLTRSGVEYLAIPTDVSRADQVEALARETVNHFGSVDLLFNNAGVMVNGLCWEKTEQEWDWILGINLKGVINGIRSFVPRMLEQETEGHIVNTSSLAGFLAAPLTGPYTVSKFAVRGLSETLHYELASIGAKLKVSVLCPGQVATDIMDSGEERPASGAPAEGQDQLNDYLRSGISAGMTPADCADIVFQAIREERFWIFPHPKFKPSYQAVVDSIVEESNPVFTPTEL